MASQLTNQLEPWHELNNKVVLVTGSSSGLGREFCIDLAKAGCRVVAAARRVDRLNSLCDEINNKQWSGSVRAVAVEMDVCADGALIESSVQKAWEAFGRIDALINNAGITGSSSSVKNPLNFPEEEWNRIIKTNLTGTWLVSKYVCIRMRDANLGGWVINISSAFGINRGLSPGQLAYAASKSGMNTMTKVMALELGVYKIRVNSISPGFFKSEITEALMKKPGMINLVRKTVPLKEFGDTDPALTSLVRYLIHDSSQYVSSNIFIVDAGTSLPGLPIFSSL